MNTQVCIATGQPLANLIPILYFKPQKVIIVVTNSMKKNAKEFKGILKDLGIAEGILMLDGCPDTDLKAIEQFLKEKLEPNLPQNTCMFNLTGGTKLHSFSMYETFKSRIYHDEFIYVDTKNRLLEYYPSKNESYHTVLPSVLTLEMTLKGMGKTVIKSENPNQYFSFESLTRFIAKNITDNQVKQLLGSLNDIISKLYNGGKNHVKEKKTGMLYQMPTGLAKKLLEKATELGLITWYGGKEIIFDNYQQARYLSGNWLEQYVYLIAHDTGFDNIRSGLQFGSQQANNSATNEIDLFIQHQNMSLAIECKSATSVNRSDFSQDMFHKLTGVAHRAGGLMCHKLFVSAFELKTKNGHDTPSVYHAREQHIKIIQSSEIIDKFPEILQKWKNTGNL